VLNHNAIVPVNHRLRAIRCPLDAVLRKRSPRFDELYDELARPSIPPEPRPEARVWMALYSVRSERLFCEELSYHLLWLSFLDSEFSEGSFNHSIFAKSYEYVILYDVARLYITVVYVLSRRDDWTTDEHLSADGTRIARGLVRGSLCTGIAARHSKCWWPGE